MHEKDTWWIAAYAVLLCTLYSYCRVLITQDRARCSDELAVECGIRMNMTAVASVGWDILSMYMQSGGEGMALTIDLSLSSSAVCISVCMYSGSLKQGVVVVVDYSGCCFSHQTRMFSAAW